MPWGFTLSFDQHNEQPRRRAEFDARIHDPRAVRGLVERLARFIDLAGRRPDDPLNDLLGRDDSPVACASMAATAGG